MANVYVLTGEFILLPKVFSSGEKAIEFIMDDDLGELKYFIDKPSSVIGEIKQDGAISFRDMALKLRHGFGICGFVDGIAFKLQKVTVNIKRTLNTPY